MMETLDEIGAPSQVRATERGRQFPTTAHATWCPTPPSAWLDWRSLVFSLSNFSMTLNLRAYRWRDIASVAFPGPHFVADGPHPQQPRSHRRPCFPPPTSIYCPSPHLI